VAPAGTDGSGWCLRPGSAIAAEEPATAMPAATAKAAANPLLNATLPDT